MLPSIFWLLFGFFHLVISTPARSQHTELRRRNFRYKLPDGYTIDRTSGVGDLDQLQVYGAILVAMITLAYENSNNLTNPISYPYPEITLNITGADDTTRYYRQFASYTLYHALETMTARNDFTASNFTLQNNAGTVACRVSLGPPSAEWQQLIGGFSSGLSPRDTKHALPAILESRQAAPGLTNTSAALEKLVPLYASDWYGPERSPQDFFMALATLIVKVSDVIYKDATINYQRVKAEGYHLNVTNVAVPGELDYLSSRGVLNICAHAYGELARRLGYGIYPITSFETTLVWTNGTALVGQHVLRFEGAVRTGTRDL